MGGIQFIFFLSKEGSPVDYIEDNLLGNTIKYNRVESLGDFMFFYSATLQHSVLMAENPAYLSQPHACRPLTAESGSKLHGSSAEFVLTVEYGGQGF